MAYVFDESGGHSLDIRHETEHTPAMKCRVCKTEIRERPAEERLEPGVPEYVHVGYAVEKGHRAHRPRP